jgi:O-methyltransferase
MLKINKMRGKLKGLFFLFRIHKIISPDIFEFISYLARLSRWINRQAGIGFSDYYTSKLNNNKREELYTWLLGKERLNGPVDYLEFGVSRGVSFKWWVKNITDSTARFYGFDTFSGLPEDWGKFKKGDMSNFCQPPEIDDDRVSFYQGLFQQTLGTFLKTYNPNERRIIHLDADLYSATIFVLSTITPFLRKGDILFFDEFNVPLHEFKAFTEWTSSFYIDYEVIGAVNNFHQVAFKIT